MKCFWCNLDGAQVERRDAADSKHLWHRRCWHAMCAWLRGHRPPDVLGKAWDRPMGPTSWPKFHTKSCPCRKAVAP